MIAPQPILFGDEIPQPIERRMTGGVEGERVVDSLEPGARDGPVDPQELKLFTRMRNRLVDDRIDLIGHRNLSRRIIAESAATWAPIT